MKVLFTIAAILISQFSFSQKLKKADKQVIANIKEHITYLADDRLEGRRTGSAGEKLAYEYIQGEFAKIGLQPRGTDNSWLQKFDVNEGKMLDSSTHLLINGVKLKPHEEFFPLAGSPQTNISASPIPSLSEHDNPWFLDLKILIDKNKNNPHFDLEAAIRQRLQRSRQKKLPHFSFITAVKLPTACFLMVKPGPIRCQSRSFT